MEEFFTELTILFQRLDILSVLDILLVAAIFFLLFSLVRGSQAVVLLRGMIVLVLAVILLTSALELSAFSWLMRTALPALLFAIPVIFAPEIRRALERLGRAGTLFTPDTGPEKIENRIQSISTAARRLAESRTGALIVIERDIHLDDYIQTGVQLDGLLSAEILLQLFHVNTPLHDGAAIVRGARVAAAACVLPLSSSGTLSRSPERKMGLRHRAALGISEVSDAVAVVISEESGRISVAHNGRMIRRLDQNRLQNILTAFYRPGAERRLPRWLRSLLGRLSLIRTEVISASRR